MEKENKLILFTDNDGKVSVNVRFANEDVWLTQEQLAQIYATTQQNISQHVKSIYADEEHMQLKHDMQVAMMTEMLHHTPRPRV